MYCIWLLQLMELITSSDFKYDAAAVNLDFLIRHGIINPDNGE